MTRTNRAMTEPPMIPPAIDSLTDDQLLAALHRPLPPRSADAALDQEEAGGMVMLSACIIAGMVLTFAVAIGWGVYHQLQGRIDRLQADLRALNTFASCAAPAKPGDTTVITIRRHEHTLANRCQNITNPIAPERALKGTTL